MSGVERWGWEGRDARIPVFPLAQPRPVGRLPAPPRPASPRRRRRKATGDQQVVSFHAGRWTLPLCVAGYLFIAISIGWGVAFFVVLGVAIAMALWDLVPTLWSYQHAHSYRQWLGTCVGLRQRLQDQVYAQLAEDARHRNAQLEHAGQVPTWVPLLAPTADRVDVLGGTSAGWRSLLRVAGLSMLDSGTSVTVLDISGERASSDLVRVAESRYRASVVGLPGELGDLNLFDGLDGRQVAAALAETVHLAGGTDERGADADALERVISRLGDRISAARIAAAIRVVLDDHSASSALTTQEKAMLADLFGAGVRRHVEPGLFRLLAPLERLASWGDGEVPVLRDAADLRVVEIADTDDALSEELLCQLVVQIAGFRLPAAGYHTLVVAGADRLRRSQVERLATLTKRRQVRLVLMFRHVRDDVVHLVGGSDATVIMRVGNPKAAELVAKLIGQEHRFVINQYTINRSQSVTPTVGVQRTYDYVVTPKQLQELSPTAFILLNPADPDAPRLGDCDPEIIRQPGALDVPWRFNQP